MSKAGSWGWAKQPQKREQHVQRSWGEKLPTIFEEPDEIREKSKGLPFCLDAYSFLFSLGQHKDQQPQSLGAEGPLERKSMSQSFEGDPDQGRHCCNSRGLSGPVLNRDL